jgi:ABC-type antimicrobial peptide transport system permease subunit
MVKSYFKIAWRSLIKNKGYSLINVGGLGVGLGVAMLIALWIYDEVDFNRPHKHRSRIARVLKNWTINGEISTLGRLPLGLVDELKTKYGSNFKHVVMANEIGDHILNANEIKISAGGIFMEAGGPEMLSLNVTNGSTSGLEDPHTLLLSQSVAKALFGNDDPVGKVVRIDNLSEMDAKVLGVYEDLPYNSDFANVKFFASWEMFALVNPWMAEKRHDFQDNFLNIYVQLQERANSEKVSAEIKDAILNNSLNTEYAQLNPQIFLQPMTDWHLRSNWKNGVNVGGLIHTVWLFGVIGVFVLVLACINFMNLSTARSEKKFTEVGVRKAIGAKRSELAIQFFSESFLIVVVAFALAIVLIASSLNFFNGISGKQMEMPWTNVYFWLAGLMFILFAGLLAGSYPSLYLSSFSPVRVLKGTLRLGKSATIPRQILVVVQFTVSVTLVIGTIVVYQQIDFAKDRPIGYDGNGLLLIEMNSPEFHGKFHVIQTELTQTGVVSDIAESSSSLTDFNLSNGGFEWRGKDPGFIAEFGTVSVTPQFGKTVGWHFTNGRDFRNDMATDSASIVINEALARILGFENPVGEVVRWNAGWRSSYNRFTVIGVIKDMVTSSPYAPVKPMVFLLGRHTNWINLRINPDVSLGEALPKIESVFKKVTPNVPFAYEFADQQYALKFADEERVGNLASIFSALAILISCLGLFGLASFMAQQRSKEIGIRKVLGASEFKLWKMLSKDFLALVIISCLIASPSAYMFLSNWLQRYNYRVEISWWVLVVTMLAAILITLLTISYHTLRAVLTNPVNSLKSE